MEDLFKTFADELEERKLEKGEKELRINIDANKQKEARQAKERKAQTQTLANSTKRTSRKNQPLKPDTSKTLYPKGADKLTPSQQKAFRDNGIITAEESMAINKPKLKVQDKPFVPPQKEEAPKPVDRKHLTVIKADLVKALMDNGFMQSAWDLHIWDNKDTFAKSMEESLVKDMFSDNDKAKYAAHQAKFKEDMKNARLGIKPEKNKVKTKKQLAPDALKEIEERGNKQEKSATQKIIDNAVSNRKVTEATKKLNETNVKPAVIDNDSAPKTITRKK